MGPIDTKAYTDKLEKQDISHMSKFKGKTPFSMLFIVKETIIESIMYQLIFSVIFILLLSFLSSLDEVKKSGVFSLIMSFKSYLDEFPDEAIFFLIGFNYSLIESFKNEIRNTCIPFFENFAPSLGKIKDKTVRNNVFELMMSMTISAFSGLQNSVSFDNLKERFGIDLNVNVGKTSEETSISIYSKSAFYNRLIEREIEYVEKTVRIEIKKISEHLMKICNKAMGYNFRRPSFTVLYIMNLSCGIYVFHMILDISLEEQNKKWLDFIIRFLIISCWVKNSSNSYYPFGDGSEKINLFNIVVRNYQVTKEILEFYNDNKKGQDTKNWENQGNIAF